MTEQGLTVRAEGQSADVHQTATDHQVVVMWLYGRPQTTQRAYAFEVQGLLAVVVKPLKAITLGDLQGYFSTMEGLAPASRARAINAVKSLFSFVHGLGYLKFNPAAAIKSPKIKNGLAERILPEAQVHLVIALEPNVRNRVLLRLLYAGGLRVSEICGLTWGDLQEREGAGQITVFGKGQKTRHVLLTAATWGELMQLRGEAAVGAPVFMSRKKGALSTVHAWRIVRHAAVRAGVDLPVSPHWLRHAHASHALDRGCPIHLVQATLGHASVATTGKYLHARPEDSSARYLGV